MNNILEWIKSDWRSNPIRFIVEFVAWIISIGCCLAVAFTAPTPPFAQIYPLWIIGCLLYCWSAWTRNSFGMVTNYLLIIAIDVIGYIRVVVHYG